MSKEDIERALYGFEHIAGLIKLGLSDAALKSADRHIQLLKQMLEQQQNAQTQ
jgi:hypothetical protein